MNKWKKWSTAWIAMFAILAATFLPSMSAAVTTEHPVPIGWESVCASEHASLHQAAPPPVSSEHDGHLDHCPLCIKQSHAVDLLVALTIALAEPAAVSPTLIPPDELPSSSSTWTFHPTRAPPASA